MGPVAGGPPSLCWALAPAPGLRVRPRDDPRQQRGRGCRGRESCVGGRPASARRPSSCLLLQADVRGHWDGRALTLPAPRGPGAHAARHCTDSPPPVTEANSGFLRDAWPVPPRSTRSRSSRVHSREPGRPRVRPRPSAPASMRCDFRPALRGVPVRAVLDVSFLVSVWRFRAGLTWCRRPPPPRGPPTPSPGPSPTSTRVSRRRRGGPPPCPREGEHGAGALAEAQGEVGLGPRRGDTGPWAPSRVWRARVGWEAPLLHVGVQ